MLEDFYTRPRAIAYFMREPLGPYMNSFADEMRRVRDEARTGAGCRRSRLTCSSFCHFMRRGIRDYVGRSG